MKCNKKYAPENGKLQFSGFAIMFPRRGRDLACPHMTVRSTTKYK